MNEVHIDQLIARIAETIGREYKPQRIILFGSYASGKLTEDSDIDLLIVKDTDARIVDRFVEETDRFLLYGALPAGTCAFLFPVRDKADAGNGKRTHQKDQG